jgi:hypothetical protein
MLVFIAGYLSLLHGRIALGGKATAAFRPAQSTLGTQFGGHAPFVASCAAAR